MQKGKVNVVVDGFWGSSGKGKLCSFLARHYGLQHASSSNMPNAGHTVQDGDKKYVFKVLPSAAAVCDAAIWLGPGSVYDPERLEQELGMLDKPYTLFVHERAAILRPGDKEQEANTESIARVASTAQGCTVAMARKRNREVDAVNMPYGVSPSVWQDIVQTVLQRGETWLHEVSQGWALSIDWGTEYPKCTSRNCDVQSALSEVGVAPSQLGEVYLNLRTYPIRVGNTLAGTSGGWWWDQAEVSWEHVAAVSGLPVDELKMREMTTVTKRQRRVATFSPDLAYRAARHNGATKIFVNFIQYVDAECAGMRGEGRAVLTKPARIFVDMVERATNIAVCGVGTGPDVDDVVWFERSQL